MATGPVRLPSASRLQLTIAEVCAELNVSRSTFYDWRAKGKASACERSRELCWRLSVWLSFVWIKVTRRMSRSLVASGLVLGATSPTRGDATLD